MTNSDAPAPSSSDPQTPAGDEGALSRLRVAKRGPLPVHRPSSPKGTAHPAHVDDIPTKRSDGSGELQFDESKGSGIRKGMLVILLLLMIPAGHYGWQIYQEQQAGRAGSTEGDVPDQDVGPEMELPDISEATREIDPVTEEDVSQISLGDSPKVVEAILGKPRAAVKMGPTTVWMYDGCRVDFCDGVVSKVPEFKYTPPPAPPAGTP